MQQPKLNLKIKHITNPECFWPCLPMLLCSLGFKDISKYFIPYTPKTSEPNLKHLDSVMNVLRRSHIAKKHGVRRDTCDNLP